MAAAPTPQKPPARALPKFCSGCGRQLVLTRERNGIDPYDGSQRWEEWLTCERFARSWRNLWWGGASHDCVSADPHSWVRKEWR